MSRQSRAVIIFSRLLLNRLIDYTLDVVLISRTRASQAPVNNPYTLYMALAARTLYNIIMHRYSIIILNGRRRVLAVE